jgi:hypothetical protein
MDIKKDISERSTYFERLLEHIFISEMLQESLFKFHKYIDILKAEIDASGYDIVMECNSIIRHIQLKTSIKGASKAKINVNIALAEKPSGCIVLIEWYVENNSRILLNYLFFGNQPGNPLPNIHDHKTGKHAKANSQGIKTERPSSREIKINEFTRLANISDLYIALFGL